MYINQILPSKGSLRTFAFFLTAMLLYGCAATSKLTSAVATDNISAVQKALKSGSKINELDGNGHTALYLAIDRKNTDLVKYLLKNQANPNIRTKDGRYPIDLAVQKGSVDIVKFLVNAGADVNQTLALGNKPIHVAIGHKHEKIFSYLLQQKADLNVANNNGDLPIVMALREGNAKRLKLLLSAGANPNTTYKNGHYVIVEAGRKNNVEAVKLLLAAGADINQAEQDGYRLIHSAVQNNNTNLVKYLIQDNVKPNVITTSGDTPIIIAAQKGNTGIIKLLVNAGADVNQADSNGTHPIHEAIKYKHSSTVKYLIQNNANLNVANTQGDYPIVLYAKEGGLEVIQLLIDAGADTNKTNRDGSRAIHYAVQKNDMKLVNILLSAGADVSQENANSSGMDMMVSAIKNRNKKLINLLAKHGYSVKLAKPRVVNGYSHTLVTDAVETGDYDIVRAILLTGGNPNAANFSNPLCAVVKLSNDKSIHVNKALKIVNLLIASGADTNLLCHYQKRDAHYIYKNEDKTTPLIQTTSRGDEQLEITRSLLVAGANIEKRDSSGYTPVFTPNSRRGDNVQQTLSLLIGMGANVNARNNKGATPLHLSVYSGGPKIIRMLLAAGADVNAKQDDGGTPLDETVNYGGDIRYPASYAALKSYGGRAYKHEQRQMKKARKKNKSSFAKIFATVAIAGIAGSADISSADMSKVMAATVNDIWIKDGEGSQLSDMYKEGIEAGNNRGNPMLDGLVRAKRGQLIASNVFNKDMKEYQAMINQQREKQKKPSLYQQQLNRIAISSGKQTVRASSRGTAVSRSVKPRPSLSTSSRSYKQESTAASVKANSTLANNSSRAGLKSECSSPVYTVPSYTVEESAALSYNSVGGKVNTYMRKICSSDKPSFNQNPKIQCDVIEKIKGKMFSKSRCTSEPFAFTCSCDQKAGSGRAM